MRPIALVFLVFAFGIFLGHDFWPKSHPDPVWHFRFHRGKVPAATASTPADKPAPAHHGRILRPPADP
jgi:hypothetical protein